MIYSKCGQLVTTSPPLSAVLSASWMALPKTPRGAGEAPGQEGGRGAERVVLWGGGGGGGGRAALWSAELHGNGRPRQRLPSGPRSDLVLLLLQLWTHPEWGGERGKRHLRDHVLHDTPIGRTPGRRIHWDDGASRRLAAAAAAAAAPRRLFPRQLQRPNGWPEGGWRSLVGFKDAAVQEGEARENKRFPRRVQVEKAGKVFPFPNP